MRKPVFPSSGLCGRRRRYSEIRMMGPAMTMGKKKGAMRPTGIAIQRASRITLCQSMARSCAKEWMGPGAAVSVVSCGGATSSCGAAQWGQKLASSSSVAEQRWQWATITVEATGSASRGQFGRKKRRSVGLAVLLPGFGRKVERDQGEFRGPAGRCRVILVEGDDVLVAPRTSPQGQAVVTGIHFDVMVLVVLRAGQPL